MGVDGIGGGGRPIPDVGSGELAGARRIEAEPIRVGAEPDGVERPEGSAALEQLARGEIDLERYLDAQVKAAVSHIEGQLPDEQIDFIRETLRGQLSTDPVLLELVRRATGDAPATR